MHPKLLPLFFMIIFTACHLGPNQTPASTPAVATPAAPTLQPTLTPTEPAATVLPSPKFELIGALGGAMKTVFVQGERAIAGVGLQLVSLDVSDPANPRPIGSLLLPQSPIAIYADDDTAYVAHAGGVSTINMVDRTTPANVGLYSSPGSAIGVTGVAGASYIYVAYQQGYDDAGHNLGSGLAVVDVSNPARPLEVRSYPTPGTIHAVTLASSAGRLYAYLAEEGDCRAGATERFICEGRLRILDVSDAGHLVETSVVKTERIAWQVAVSADRAYVAQNQCDDEAGCRGGVVILDVSDPVHPRSLGFHNRPTDSMAVAGSYLYLGDSFNLFAVDVSDPAAPQEHGPFEMNGRVEAVAGRYLYLADRWNSVLRVVDVANPISPTAIGAYDAPGPTSPRSVRAAGQYTYVTDDIRQGLAVIDVSNPIAPHEAGFIEIESPGKIWDIHQPYLYLGDEWLGLYMVDISTPAALAVTGFYRPPDGQRVLAVAAGLAYVTTAQGWQIVDLSDPATPREVGVHATASPSSWLVGAAVEGEQFYTVAYEDGWQVVDWSDPAAPVEQGFAALPSGPQPLIVADYAYVATVDGLQIFDLANSVAPAKLGFYQVPGTVQKVAAVGSGYALVVVDLKLHIVDVSNPAAPLEVGVYEGLQPVDAAALAPGPAGQLYAYLYSPAGRVEVVDLSNPATPLRLGSYTLSQAEWLPVNDILMAGQYAYLSGPAIVVTVDISNPTGPFEAGRYQTEGGVRVVRSASGAVYGYVWDFDNNLRVVDLSNPATPQEVGLYDAPQNIIGLVPGDNALYLSLEGGLDKQVIQRLDISNPTAPQEAGRYETGLLSGGMTVVGNHLYLQSGRQLARAIDVSNPARPVEVGAVAIPQATSIEQLFAAPNRLYLVVQQPGGPNSDSLWELQVIDIANPAVPAVGGTFVPVLPALYRVLAAAAGELYFADRQGQVRLADVSNPAAPRDLGVALNFSPAGYVETADLAGDELYLGLNELGLVIFSRP